MNENQPYQAPQPVAPPVAPNVVYQVAYQPSAPASGKAIASLVLALVGMPLMLAGGLGALCFILAIIFGHMARGEVARAIPQGSVGGGGLALAGLIISYIMLGIAIVALMFLGTAIMTALRFM